MFDYTDEKFDSEMLQCLRKLVERAEQAGATEQTLVRYLFLDRFAHDALMHLNLDLSPEDRLPLIKMLLGGDANTLQEVAADISSALSSLGITKKAYPIRVDTAVYTVNKRDFTSLAASAVNLISSGIKESDAIRRTIADLSMEDRLAFLTWYGLKYKDGRNMSYLCAQEEPVIKKVAYDDADNSFIYEFYKRQPAQDARKEEDNEPEQEPEQVKSHVDPLSAQEFKKMRDKMVSRTFAIDKLLEKYRHLLKEEQFDAIEDGLNSLRKNIRKLKTATLHDSIAKVAFIVEQNNWFEGADLIRKIAANDEVFVKQAGLISNPEDMSKVLDSLEEISSFLRQRAIIRELSARDIDIFNLGFGHMSEIGDAAAKLMEAFNGAANKIEDLTGKLRAELQQQTAPKTMPSAVKPLVKPQDLPLVKALEPPPEPVPAEEPTMSEPDPATPELESPSLEVSESPPPAPKTPSVLSPKPSI